MAVPFFDLKALHGSIWENLSEAVQRVLESSTYILGPEVESLEREFAEYCGAPYGVATGSGTSALHLALLAAGVGPGHEVITVSHTFIATAEAITAAGAVPVFVDIDPVSYTMDPSRVESAVTARTRAILPVHLYGQAADLGPILEVARRHGLAVIEDACQAHGATYDGRKVGSLGDIGCFSFYPSKNLGAVGEGGIAVTNSPKLAGTMRSLRDHGQVRRYHHDVPGFNYRMDAIQGAVLGVKLRWLDRWNAARRRLAHLYDRLLQDTEVATPVEMGYGTHVYHLYVIRSKDRDDLKAQLSRQGVGTGIHYPIPIHLQRAYVGLGYGLGSLPITEACAAQALSLPMYPTLTPAQVEEVATAISKFALARRLVGA